MKCALGNHCFYKCNTVQSGDITHSVFMLRMALRDIIASVTAFLNCLKEQEKELKTCLKHNS